MKKLAVIAGLLASIIMPVQPVFAHVLITDGTKTKGAILHIVPDDDPIAGQQATLYFDAQDRFMASDSSIQLSIRDAAGNEKIVKTKLDGALVTATYTFPAQGVYNLAFTVTSNGKTYVFSHVQRVSRGATASAVDRPVHTWAEALLFVSGVGFALLAIVAYNKRKDIAKQSTF